MRVRAAVLRTLGLPPPYARSRPLEIAELDLAPPGRGEVLVRVGAAGLCHSDLSVIDGSRPRPVPMALGHEAAGVVEALGGGVTDLAVGDHVVLVFVPSCGRCGPCAAGRPALCEPGARANGAGSLLSGERRLSYQAGPVNHHLGVSAFADHAVVARESCVRIDPDLPLDLAALFGCAVLTGVGAVINTARVEPGATVAVVGLGGVGLSAVIGARLAGARQIVAVDLSEEKLAFARRLGATDAVNAASPDAVQTVRGLSGGGVAFAFDMAGA
ncbi:MAG TPA: alcohol dehydrogenase catalytic domain-containing protein, partial [Roseiarcus sp.]|nr:alcohol dehydrogenase catalytic domain-containing protein [Roseiarcus sp.]